MQVKACIVLLFTILTPGTQAVSAQARAGAQSHANPMRRVVTMLQMMQKKVEAEGEKEKELFDKFMCYCDTSKGELNDAIGSANDKIPDLESVIKESTATEGQLKQELKEHKTDREDAEKAIAESTEMRKKEEKAFAAESSESKANIDALAKAIPAIEKGMSKDLFLQTDVAVRMRTMLLSLPATSLEASDREMLSAFLSTGSSSQDGEPSSGEILGIMKQMKEDMEGDLKELIAQEESAKSAFDELVMAKQKEIIAATKAIEEKTGRVGDVAVELAESKNALEDVEDQLSTDQDMLAGLIKECDLRKKDFEMRSKTRAMEMVALADTIKMLNDDDAMELFKKTLPSASFVQVSSTSHLSAKRRAALHYIHGGRPGMYLISSGLRNKKVSMTKVVKMIDDMMVLLKKEQVDDDKKKEYCTAELDKVNDEKAEQERVLKDLQTKLADHKEALETVDADIAALKAGITKLDISVATATQARKEEHDEFVTLMTNNNAAIQLIEMAKNRLNKFYNPKLYKPPAKRELSEADRITLNMGGTLAPTAAPGGIAGTGITALQQDMPVFAQVRAKARDSVDMDDAFGVDDFVSYKKQTEESGGVIAMMDLLKADLVKEVTEAKIEEKDSQEEYEKMMKAAATKREQDSKSIVEKEGVKSTSTEAVNVVTKDITSATKELGDTVSILADLHNECDFLLKAYDQRKQSRADEIEGLSKAKAVLAGADYSFLQTGERTSHLRASR
eukprot:gnl/MRDRNA2_/MRDRNA2_86911_c0_seq1.p1 gnl/MRDRNA2_/MRDRNA2_86911_c0~~gnl/MRDRNA2_/MRDRNA2_86911_c0_seq1.p1  ORF type:complete len:735 (+),score=224.88 gnl/MRDRNA2_/MRDRNA2_86911_c0_seq1:69-2273(+)